MNDAGKVSQELAKAFAESEFEKYRLTQDKFFESDFDREMKNFLKESKILAQPISKSKPKKDE